MSCKPAHSTAAPWGCEESSEAAVVSRTAPVQKPPWDVSLEGSVDEQPAQPKYGAGAQSYQPPTQSFKPAHNTEAPWGADGHTDAPVLPKNGAYKDTSLWNNDQNEAPTSRMGPDHPHDAQGAAQATYDAGQTMQAAKLRNAGSGSLW